MKLKLPSLKQDFSTTVNLWENVLFFLDYVETHILCLCRLIHQSFNKANIPLFFHSVALDPLYPSQCSWETFGYATGGGFNGDTEGLTPLRLSGQLNSLGCSVIFHQGDSVSMVKLIEQVRQRQTL